jgi:hypothetical protein
MIKSLNKTATAIFEAAIQAIPDGATSAKIDKGDQEHGGGIMALHVEKIGSRKNGDFYSFAHYYEQNGDMMRDPDVVMLRCAGMYPGTVPVYFPTAYRQDGLGIDREYVIFNETGNGYKIAKKMQADLSVFCNQWARNLKEQQGLTPVDFSQALTLQAAELRYAEHQEANGETTNGVTTR